MQAAEPTEPRHLLDGPTGFRLRIGSIPVHGKRKFGDLGNPMLKSWVIALLDRLGCQVLERPPVPAGGFFVSAECLRRILLSCWYC